MDSESTTPSACSVESKDESNIDAQSESKSAPKPAAKSKKSRKRKKPDVGGGGANTEPPTKKRKKRGWSDEEEALFRSGLDLFGRDWKAVAGHIGNERNAASIRSHAQVHFLKLLAERQPLPEKVRESGTGYTLSGEPLNKYSSIAVRQFGGADKVPLIEGVVSDEEAAKKRQRPKGSAKTADSKKSGKAAKPKKAKNKKKKKKRKYYDSSSDEEAAYGLSTLKVSASAMPRRSGRARHAVRGQMALHETDPFGLRTDIELYAPFESGAKERGGGKWSGSCSVRQPFAIFYCPNALLLADVHCHLCLEVEVMGLLGGDYDAESGRLLIRKCFPLREEEQGEQSVAADASHHLESIEAMKAEGLQPVGWYHSHPRFENVPSNTDCHQHFLHKFPDETVNPYVGLIVSSWSAPDTASGRSHFRFFNSTMDAAASYTPFECHTDTEVTRPVLDAPLLAQIDGLIERYSASKYDIFRSDLGGIWEGSEMSRIDKILHSVRGHSMPRSDCDGDGEGKDIEVAVERIRQMFVRRASVWWMTNRPKKEEVAAAVKAEEERVDAASSSKENENSINVQ